MHAFEGSILENQRVAYGEIEPFLNGYGFVVGGGWEHDHGYFDKKLKENAGHLYLRIPAYVLEGNFGDAQATLQLGTPFMLRHQYESGIDEEGAPSLLSASINQFAEPKEADASLDQQDLEAGERVLRQVEQGFRQHFLS